MWYQNGRFATSRGVPHRHINRQDGEAHKGKCEHPLGSLRTIPEGQDEAHQNQAHVEIFQDQVCNMDSLEIKRRIFHRVRQDDEGDVVVSLGIGFISNDREKFRRVRLTRANQEKMRLKTW